MDKSIAASHVNLYAFPTGRRVYTAQEVAKRAARRALDRIARHAFALAAHDRKTLEMEIRRRTSGRGYYGAEATHLDNLLDRCLSGVDGYLDAQIRLYTGAHQRGRAAARIREAAFPEGVAAITKQSYVQQCISVEIMLDRLAAPDLADAVAVLPDFAPIVARVRELNAQYRASIDGYERGVPTPEQVRAAQMHGQGLLAELLILILAHFIADAPDDAEALADLLEPIMRQNEAIRLNRQRRRAPVDVDPETGDELAEDELDVDALLALPGDAPETDIPAGPAL